MPIIHNKKGNEFHLYNNKISYIIRELANRQMGQVYFGKRVRHRESYADMINNSCRPISSNPVAEDPNFSLEFARQEYPAFGTSDFREPAYEIIQKNGSHIMEFVFDSFRIIQGKPETEGLPHSYVENKNEAWTLEICMTDHLTGVKLVMFYSIYENAAVIVRSVRFINTGSETVCLKRAMSMSLDISDSDYEWLQFSGAWGRERTPFIRDLEKSGVTMIESMRGHSSSQHNPFVILKRKNTTEDEGEAFGFNLVYSGNFMTLADSDTFDHLRLMMGINPRNFCWNLEPDTEFQTPEVIITYTRNGLNELSGSIHSFLRSRVARGYWRDRTRPVVLNNWEATGMDFTEKSILEIAKKGAEAGIELFVLDDGWFGSRKEESGLGDWFPDRSKLPGGLKGLSEKIHAMGMKFGIWIEPEMVNPDSELYRQHPEYVLRTPSRNKSLGRNQLVLDFSDPEVVEHIFNSLSTAFDGVGIDYIKWDMNASVTECYSAHWPAEKQGEVYHRYMLGVYSLYEKMTAAYPQVLFESCASGGCRFDAGMLYYAPQAWCSDDTDAIERIKIQYGSSYGYPVSSFGAHVSAVPNQQTGRSVSLKTRGNTAFFGAFGYEMDLTKLSDEEFRQVREQIRFVKEYREVLQKGRFYRLGSPFEKDIAAWMSVSDDQRLAIVGVYIIKTNVNMGFRQIKLKGLNPSFDYEINGKEIQGGDILMEYGFTPQIAAEYPKVPYVSPARPIEISGEYDSKIYVLNSDGDSRPQ